jgi:hypothetical protein
LVNIDYQVNEAEWLKNQIATNNLLALTNQRNATFPIDWTSFPTSQDGKIAFAWIYNYAYQPKSEIDSAIYDTLVQWEEDNAVGPYGEKLMFAQFAMHLKSGYLQRGMILLENLENTFLRNAGYYAYLHGMIAMENGAFEKSVEKLEKAVLNGYQVDPLYLFLSSAKSEAREKSQDYLKILQSAENRADSILIKDLVTGFFNTGTSTASKYWTWAFKVDPIAIADLLKNKNEALVKQTFKDLMEQHAIDMDGNAILTLWRQIPEEWRNEDDFVRWYIVGSIFSGTYDGVLKTQGWQSLDYAIENMAQAFISKKQNQQDECMKYIQQAWSRNPIHASIPLLAAFLSTGIENNLLAYEILLSAKSIHPNNTLISAQFALLALQNGLDEIAESEYVKLKSKMDSEKWKSFDNEYEKIIIDRKNREF